MALSDTLGSSARRPGVSQPGQFGQFSGSSFSPGNTGTAPSIRGLSPAPLYGSPRAATSLPPLSHPLISGSRGTVPQEAIGNPSIQRIVQMAQTQGRPMGFLSAVMKVLSTGNSAAAGFSRGYFNAVDKAISESKGSIWDKIGFDAAPWEWITAIGAGFSEIPDAVKEGESFQNLLQDRWSADSWFYRHAKPVGLSLDIVLDPINYVSFGATTPGKIAARNLWRSEWGRSIEAAKKGIADQKIAVPANKKIGAPAITYGELGLQRAAIMEHMDAMRPWTLGDALSDLRQTGLRTREDMIAGKMGRAAQLKATLIPGVRVPGGRGIRYAGMELPGTPQMLDYISQGVANKLKRQPKLNIEDLLQYNGGDLLPDHLVDELMDDIFKTTARVDFREFIETTLKTDMTVWDKSLRTLHSTAIESMAAARMVTAGGKGLRTSSLEERQPAYAALHGGPVRAGPSGNAARQVLKSVNARKKEIYTLGEDMGIDKGRLDGLWSQAVRDVRNHDDPTAALYEFEWRAMSEVTKMRFIDEILTNPMYATKIRKTGDEVSGFSADLDRGFLPRGMLPLNHRGQQYAVRKEVHEAIDKFRNPATMDNEIKKFFKYMGKAQDLWKIPATVMNPSFHAMNFVGAVWNNLLGGVWNPVDYVRAAGVMYGHAVEEAVKANEGLGRRTPLQLGRRAQSTPFTRQGEETFQAAEQRGGLGRSSFIFADISGQRSVALKEGGEGDLTHLERQYKRKPAESKTRYAARQGRRAAGAAAFATGNIPLGILGFAPEIAGAGRVLGGAIEDMVRLAPFLRQARDPYIKAYLDEFGPVTVPNMTHPGFSSAEQSLTYNIGAQVSTHFQFDYTDLSLPERYLKTVFPFWVYYKNNFLLQLKELGKAPRHVNTTVALANYIAEQGQDLNGLEAVLPTYFDNLGAFQIPVPAGLRSKLGLPDEEPLFINPKLPFYSAFAMFPPFWDFLRDTNENTIQKMGRILVAPVGGAIGPFAAVPIPGAKLMFEAWANHSLGLGRPLDFQRASSNDVRHSYVPAPSWTKYLPDALKNWVGIFESPSGRGKIMPATWEYMLTTMASPFVTNMGKAVPTAEAYEEKSRADMISWLTGIRLMPVDALRLSRAWGYQMENSIEGKRAELKEQGLELPPEEIGLLRELRAHLRVIESAYDARFNSG